jgi:uncharacterized protein YdiU (UPF0061 family)
MSSWSSLQFHQRYLTLPSTFYTCVTPTPLVQPTWVAWNAEHAADFDLPTEPDSSWLALFAGQTVPEHIRPLAMKYAGHQFGVYNPHLGDGRGVLLGEIADKQHQLHEIHLKGAGTTPYSRSGDGRAVLRSTIREYLASEAMHGLGIPTTRALGMITSETVVYRERQEQGAILIRTAPSHIRFGHFEHFYYNQQHEDLKLLADNVIQWYFPWLKDKPEPYTELFNHVVVSTASLMAQWQSVGFAHGVMNTDNMSILGLTFDYGPYAFLDDYEPNFICNHSDYQGRYAFDKQPYIGLWNLSALAQAFSTLVPLPDLQAGLANYDITLNQEFSKRMRQKLGLKCVEDQDSALFSDMFALMTESRVDYTRFFRQLSYLDHQPVDAVTDLFVNREQASSWLKRYLDRCTREVLSTGNKVTAAERCEAMRKVNPKYILRNYLAQQAIVAAEQGDFGELNTLILLLRQPYDEHPEYHQYARLPPQWGKELEISCSS